MHKAKDLLEMLGFNKEASESTKEAFLKNLSRAAQASEKAEVIPVVKKSQETKPLDIAKTSVGQQLSFHFSFDTCEKKKTS